MPLMPGAAQILPEALVLGAAGALLAIGVEEVAAVEMIALRPVIEIRLGAAGDEKRKSEDGDQASRRPTPIEARADSASPETTG
jgi:hypothetical protein